MSGLVLQIGATKLLVSVVLAGAAWIVHRRVGSPAVSHPLWLLVLVTLLVPAVVSLPVLPAEPDVVIGTPATGSAEVALAEGDFDSARGARFSTIAGPGVAIAWLLGTMGLLTWSLLQTVRFQRRLTSASWPASGHLQREAAAIGHDLGLARIPQVLTTGAHVTPMVWWVGGRVRVLVPTFLLTELSRDELHAILAHELAHVRRRDHLVRWLEWLACAVFWWNPVAWWARRQLRIAEESCCDRLALDAGSSSPGIYANALLKVVANASRSPGFRPPLPASAAGGVGRSQILERRLRMIISTDTRSPAPRRLRALTWGAVLCVLPFGLVYCDKAATPVADEDEAPPEAESLEEPGETFAGDLADILTRREEDIHRSIQEKVESGALDERRGGLLSAYVSGAKAGLLIHYEGRDLSDDEKQAVADRLTASAERVNPAPGAAMEDATVFRKLLMDQLATEMLAMEAELKRIRRVQLLRVPRPPFPIIVREKPPVPALIREKPPVPVLVRKQLPETLIAEP